MVAETVLLRSLTYLNALKIILFWSSLLLLFFYEVLSLS